eukprot:911613-Amphidinium_carterae.1
MREKWGKNEENMKNWKWEFSCVGNVFICSSRTHKFGWFTRGRLRLDPTSHTPSFKQRKIALSARKHNKRDQQVHRHPAL